MDGSEDSGQDQEGLAGEILDSVGMDGEAPTDAEMEQSKDAPHMQGDGNSGKEIDLPTGVKERLGRQEKRHQREIRQMRQQLEAMQQMMQPQQSNFDQQQMNGGYGEPNAQVDDQIHKAVSAALRAQDEAKRQAQEREAFEHVNKKYEALQGNLDRASDKYEDFDDVVMHSDAPYTPAMRDAALFLDNPADVLYKLGKNPDELKRIAKLHPVDQAKEMVKLSHALMSGSGNGDKSNTAPRTIGQVKSNPVNTTSVNQNTPVSEIRRRMKSGDWKSNRH